MRKAEDVAASEHTGDGRSDIGGGITQNDGPESGGPIDVLDPVGTDDLGPFA